MSELTDAVVRAKRGVQVATLHLASLLPKAKLLLPLARRVPAGSSNLAYHAVETPKGERFCPLFTDDRLLSEVGHHRGWKTEGGHLEIAEMPAVGALESALAWAREGLIRGVVLDPFHPSALELLPDEVEGLLSGNARALRRHLQRLPIQPEEKFITRPPARPLPKKFLGAVEQAVRSSAQFARFNLMEVVSAERDLPSLLLSIDTKVPVDGPTSAEAVSRAIAATIPEGYSHVDIMFLGAGTTQQPRR